MGDDGAPQSAETDLTNYSNRVRLKLKQHLLVIGGWCNASGGIELQGACWLGLLKNGTPGKESGGSMDALTIVWQLGQSLSLFGLAAGAVLVFLSDEPYFGQEDHPSPPYLRHIKNTQTVYPRVSRRRSFSKGAPSGDLRFGSAVAHCPRSIAVQNKWHANLLSTGSNFPPGQVGTMGATSSTVWNEVGQEIY